MISKCWYCLIMWREVDLIRSTFVNTSSYIVNSILVLKTLLFQVFENQRFEAFHETMQQPSSNNGGYQPGVYQGGGAPSYPQMPPQLNQFPMPLIPGHNPLMPPPFPLPHHFSHMPMNHLASQPIVGLPTVANPTAPPSSSQVLVGKNYS